MPENTSERDPIVHLMGAMSDGGMGDYITGMEKQGQTQLLRSQQMPKEAPWDALEALGFVKGDDADDLFVICKLPDGWEREGSDHAMWSYIKDERGIRRVSVFYKAAFYDRSAHAGLVDPGYDAATKVVYGDDEPALPEQWSLFTEGERESFWGRLEEELQKCHDHPSIYGKYEDRLTAVLALRHG